MKKKSAVVSKSKPRSLAFAAKGIQTAGDFANMMSALMSDLAEGRVPPGVGNAMCNAGSKLLKIVELQYRYGVQVPGQTAKVLRLAEFSLEHSERADPAA